MVISKKIKKQLELNAFWFILFPPIIVLFACKKVGNHYIGPNLFSGLGNYFYDVAPLLLFSLLLLFWQLNLSKRFILKLSLGWALATLLLAIGFSAWCVYYIFLLRWISAESYSATFVVLFLTVGVTSFFSFVSPKFYYQQVKLMPWTTLGCVLSILTISLGSSVVNYVWKPMIYSTVHYLEFVLRATGFQTFKWKINKGVWLHLDSINWRILLSPSCGGLQGIFLFMFLYFLVYFRDGSRLRGKALLFFFIGGIALMFWMNIFRLTTMIYLTKFIHENFSKQMAQIAFTTVLHPYMGILLYSLATLGYFFLVVSKFDVEQQISLRGKSLSTKKLKS